MNLRQIRSVKGPAALFVVSLVCVVALLVLWNVGLGISYRRLKELATADQAGGAFHWTFIGVGSGLFVTTIALLSVLGGQLISEIRQSQRTATFIATFTHELNSPLASIKLFAQTLRRGGLEPAQHDRFLSLILEDVERLRGRISNVLRAAQLDSPLGLETALEEVELNAWLEDHFAARRLGLERVGAARLDVEPGAPALVVVDKALLRQALDNLLDNAIKYARPDQGGARVRVVVLPGSRPEHVAIEVRDEGVGIHAGDLERIFERFKRAEQGPQTRCQGTGLGLWVVRTIVEALDGEVWATSPGPDKGTTIRIELPCRAGAPSASTSEARRSSAADAAAPALPAAEAS